MQNAICIEPFYHLPNANQHRQHAKPLYETNLIEILIRNESWYGACKLNLIVIMEKVERNGKFILSADIRHLPKKIHILTVAYEFDTWAHKHIIRIFNSTDFFFFSHSLLLNDSHRCCSLDAVGLNVLYGFSVCLDYFLFLVHFPQEQTANIFFMTNCELRRMKKLSLAICD